MGTKLKIILFVVVAATAALAYWKFSAELTLDNLKAQRSALDAYYRSHQIQMIAAYVGIYVLSVAISLPGATVLTLAGGAVFGFWLALLIVSFASTIGATLAFLFARFLLRDWLRNKFGEKLKKLDEGVQREGAFYLFTLRLVPLFPFFLVNLLMALTPIGVLPFFVVSQLGMLPGTAAYVSAGTQLSRIDSLRGILSPGLVASFAAIGLLPHAARWIVTKIRHKAPRRKSR